MRTLGRVPIAVAAAGAVGAALAVLAASLWPVQSRDPARLPDVAQVQMGVCPLQGSQGQLIGATAAGVGVRTLDGQPVRDPNRVGATVTVTQASATGVLPSGVVIAGPQGRSFAACAEPASTSSVQVADPSRADLLLVNPDRTDAVVNLALASVNGSVTSAGSRGLTVPGGQTKVVPISVLVPGADPVTVTQSTSQGRVVMVSRIVTGGVDQMAAQQASSVAVVAGMPGGSAAKLMLGNPGETRAQVKVTALTGRGAFVPAGAESLVIDPNSTLNLDLTTAMNGEPGALQIESDQPVVSTALVQVGTDQALVSPAASSTRIDDVAASGVVQVVNVEAQPVIVTVASGGKTSQLRVPARGAAGTQVQAEQRLTITSDRPVSAAAVLSGAGIAVQPLSASAAKTTVASVEQDPGLR